MKEPTVVMTIAGSDSGGGAGIQADLKTFAVLDVHGTCAITSITSQNTLGVLAVHDLPIETIDSQIKAVTSDMNIAYAKTGMLSSSGIIRKVTEIIKINKIPLVVDPVMAAEAGGSLMQTEALSTLQEELIPLSTVITPNIHEAETLCGISIHDWQDAKQAAKHIVDCGANAVIITGGHLDGSDLLFDGADHSLIKGSLIKGGTHGAGCTYSAALSVFLAKGESLNKAAYNAKSFVTNAIMQSRPIGQGVGPVNSIKSTLQDAYRYKALQDVTKAFAILGSSDDIHILIPEVGCNIVSALPYAAGVDEVCAIQGRIVRLNALAHSVGCPAFGASSHVARIVLAAMQYDSQLKSAINIKYSEKILQVILSMGFTIASFDREHEPSGTGTMEWGTAHAIKTYIQLHNKIPEIIYDRGAVGKEPMIRLLSYSAEDAANRAVKIAKALKKSSK